MNFRNEKKHLNNISLETPIANNGFSNQQISLYDVIPSTDDFVKEIEDREISIKYISVILNLLEPRDRLIKLYQIAGFKQRDIATKCNLSQSYISRIVTNLDEQIKLYVTTRKQFKEFFSMTIVEDFYQISFASSDIKNFNDIFEIFLQKQTSFENLPDFNIICDDKRVIIQVPTYTGTFYFIAQIIQEIDNYSLAFASNKNLKHNDNNSPQKQSIVSNLTEQKTTPKIMKDSQIKHVKDYMMTLEYFTVKELRQHFPQFPYHAVYNTIQFAKLKGLILNVSKGKYKVVKN